MAAYSNNIVPSLQEPGPASDTVAPTEASLEAASGLGEVASPLEASEGSSIGDGGQGQVALTNPPNTCSSNADDNFDMLAILDAMPSQASSAASVGWYANNTVGMILSSHRTNTGASLGDELQCENAPSFPIPSLASLDEPWNPDSQWATYKIPEEFDNQGRPTAWTEVTLRKVMPYVPVNRQDQSGGSGLLDSEDPTHYYLMMPIESLDTTPEVPEYIAKCRAAYIEAVSNAPEVVEQREWFIRCPANQDGEGDQGGKEGSNESCNEEEVEIIPVNDTNADFRTNLARAPPVLNPELGVINLVATSHGLSNPGTALFRAHGDFRPSRKTEEIIDDFNEHVEDTGSSICSMSSISSHYSQIPRTAEEQAYLDSFVPEEKQRVSEAEDMRAHNVLLRITVTTADGGTVRVDMPRVISASYPGQPTREAAFSIFNLSKTCWDIIKEHGIANVTTIDAEKTKRTIPSVLPPINRIPYVEPASNSPGYDSAWVQNNAKIAMKAHFPTLGYYEAIQATCDDYQWSLKQDDIRHFYEDFSPLVAHYLLNKPLAAPITASLEELMADGLMEPVDERNLTVPQFIKRLFIEAELRHEYHRKHAANDPDYPFWGYQDTLEDAAAMVDDWPVQERVVVPENFDHNRNYFDLQQFKWPDDVGLPPHRVRLDRDRSYRPSRKTYQRLSMQVPVLHEGTNMAHFVPKAMYTKYKASTPHKQLRNLMACKGYNAVVYASDRGKDSSKVFHYFPFYDTRECIMDLSKTSNETVLADAMVISTLALSTGDYYRGICMVGGLEGEYAIRNMLHEAEDRSVITGHATKADYGIINHIDIDYFANEKYLAVMACNDNKVRILDVETNNFLSNPGSNSNTVLKSGQLSGHRYPFAVNCTSMCPDGKMRAVVGDTTDVVIVDAQSGRAEHILRGHEDYGFAVSWSPDGRYVASANQDLLVKIWDARTWRVVTEFASRNSGYSSIRWSPVGGGSKCLLLAEPADRVCVVNATTFEACQTHSFYGEITGIDFIGDGTGYWVANGDEKFGGMMEFERRGYGMQSSKGFMNKEAVEKAGGVYREEGANEWVWEEEREEDPRVVDPTRMGAAGNWMSMGLM